MRPLLVLVMLGSLLSGCTALGDGPDLMTAKQALGPADRAAERWAADAVLVDAGSQELDGEARREAADELADEREELKEARDDGDISESDYDNYTELMEVFEVIVQVADGKVGDGRSSLWGFTYKSEAEQDLYLVAVAHGDVVYKESMRALEGGEEMDWDDFLDTQAVGDWKVDSDEASTAARLNEDFTRICGGKNVASFLSLSHGDDGPVWSVGAMAQGEDEDDYAFLAVDAVNGSLIVDETVVPGPVDVEDILFAEAGEVEGAVQAAIEASQAGAFEVEEEGHAMLALHARMQPPPLQPATITVTDPEGHETELVLARGAAPFVALADAMVPGVPVGAYEVELSMQVAVSHEWTLYWCTDGVPADQDDFENPACQALGGAGMGGGQSRAETLSPVARWLPAWQA